jgi:glycolate oxidase
MSNYLKNCTKQDLYILFSVFLETTQIISDPESKRPFECDGLAVYSQLPLLVLLPDTVEQVKKILSICERYQVPVITRGAGTGLSAGAMPHKEGVLLCMSKFNKILEIDPLARTARVQPGVRNALISELAHEYGLFYGPDPSSQIACSIGGNVAENAGGAHCLKYGLTVHNVVALEVLLTTGELVQLGSESLCSTGYDLLALMHGSEGLLGIITEITVKLIPLPEAVCLIVAGFADVPEACSAVNAVISAGIVPAALEMMDSTALIATENFVHAGYPLDAKALLLCEVDGSVNAVDQQMAEVKAIFTSAGATSLTSARNKQDIDLLWKGRKSAFPAIGKISADYYCMDGTIPRHKLAYVLGKIEELSKHYKLSVANVFHAGDGNLHPLIMFDGAELGAIERAEKMGAEILQLCVKVGGCISGEHGVGVEKLRQMPFQFSDDELQHFHRLKSAFDPSGLLNPGKGVPELHFCQEYRSIGTAIK